MLNHHLQPIFICSLDKPYPSTVEVATILSSLGIISLLSPYDINRTSDCIRSDISRILRVHGFDKYIAKQNSTIHLIDDRFNSTNGIKKSTLYSTEFYIEDDKFDILQISPTSSTIIFRQIPRRINPITDPIESGRIRPAYKIRWDSGKRIY